MRSFVTPVASLTPNRGVLGDVGAIAVNGVDACWTISVRSALSVPVNGVFALAGDRLFRMMWLGCPCPAEEPYASFSLIIASDLREFAFSL